MALPRICNSHHKLLVDTHCHTFNAADVPVFGFVYRSVLGGDDEGLDRILKPLVRLLERLARAAPNAEEEFAKLEQLGAAVAFEGSGAPLLETLAMSSADGLGGEMAGYESVGVANVVADPRFREDLALALAGLETSNDLGERELYAALEREAEDVWESGDIVLDDLPAFESTGAVSELAAAPSAFAGPAGVVGMAALLLRGGRLLGRYIRWIALLRRYRFEIVGKLVETYGERNGCVDLFTPAQIDLDRWLDDPIRTSHDDQVELMARIIRLAKGRIHALAAFDPWRECDAPDAPNGSLLRVEKAVTELGFIGVKIYPPMGFSGLGNARNDYTRLAHVANPSESKVFGGKLDEALLKLYRWCEDHGVPLMAHCEETLGSRPGWEERANPMFWQPVVERFPKLRLNLAHFGGANNLIELSSANRNGWTDTIGELMSRPGSNVFADIGHFDELTDTEQRRRFFDGLENFFASFPAAEDRLMFGTDWILLAKEKGSKQYLRLFADGLLDRCGEDIAVKVLGLNAVRFLGLAEGEPNRRRLEAFWQAHGIARPAWTERIPG